MPKYLWARIVVRYSLGDLLAVSKIEGAKKGGFLIEIPRVALLVRFGFSTEPVNLQRRACQTT
jgi:hypothetical protein